ncbi:tape measure protein [Sedimentibacter sp.]|uniref:tape measure protein n=1 Tax=Sedimentibacter sp. TaxID=1960295 RepID=UPI0028B21610|nr:tape measure protein [Sedimentibacter sp.]
MSTDISISISVRDNFSSAITTMKNASNSFKKDVTDLQNKLDMLNNSKITLKVETDKAKSALREAEKAFRDLGEAAGEEQVKSLKKANYEYEQARKNLSLLSKEARNTEKDILNLTGAVNKTDNKVENRSDKVADSLASSFASSVANKLIGDMLENVAGGAINSIYGDTGSTVFSNVLSGAMSGMVAGSVIPGIGNVVGTAIGAGVGLVNAGISIFGKKDEAFKSVVQSSFEDTMQAQNETLIRGSSVAGNREMKQVQFANILGSDEAAKDYLAEMTKFAAKTPFEYDQLAEISKTLLSYGYKQDELIPLLTKVGDAGSALGLNAGDINSVAAHLGRMKTTDKADLTDLNSLKDKGIPVWDYLAEASGKTKEDVQEMVSKGLVPGAEVAKAISDYMGTNFAGSMEKQSETFEGLMSSLEETQSEIDNAMGEGYNEERKKGIQAQIDYFEGESGEKIKEANRMIGEWKASLENDREAAIRDAMDGMMESDEYKDAAAEGNRVKMGALLAEAQVRGENEYKAGDKAQLQLDTEKELVQKIREDTALQDEYWNAGLVMGQAFSKGRIDAIQFTNSDFEPSYRRGKRGVNTRKSRQNAKKHAYGLNYVPYDDFPALLHQGERVLTASENRSSKTIPQVNITGNEFNVRSDDDIERIGDVIVKKLVTAYEVM